MPRAVVLLSGGLDSYTAAAVAQARRLRPLRAQRALRPAARRGARGRAPGRRALGVGQHLELDVDLSRMGGSALTADIAVPKDQPIEAGTHSGHLRAGAQHRVPVAGAGLGRGAGRVRPGHRRERARLLRLSRLPARVHPGVRGAGPPGDEGRRRGRRPSACTPRCCTCRRPTSCAWASSLGLDYGLTHSCYDPRRATAGRAATATAAGCARPASATPASLDPLASPHAIS